MTHIIGYVGRGYICTYRIPVYLTASAGSKGKRNFIRTVVFIHTVNLISMYVYAISRYLHIGRSLGAEVKQRHVFDMSYYLLMCTFILMITNRNTSTGSLAANLRV